MTSPYRPGTSSMWRWIGGPADHQGEASPEALADRERRAALGPRADLTGRLLGDPPPGRSALEKKLATTEGGHDADDEAQGTIIED